MREAGGRECRCGAAHRCAAGAEQSPGLGLCMGWLLAKGKRPGCEHILVRRHGNRGSKEIYPVELSKGL